MGRGEGVSRVRVSDRRGSQNRPLREPDDGDRDQPAERFSSHQQTRTCQLHALRPPALASPAISVALAARSLSLITLPQAKPGKRRQS